MIQALAFYFFSAITLGSATMVLAARNPVHSIFFLILAFFSSAGLWVLLGAEFLAMVLVVVYVGAVAVLFLFVVMMLDIPAAKIRSWITPDIKAFFTSTWGLLRYLALFSFCLLLGTVISAAINGLILLGTVYTLENKLVSLIEVLSKPKEILIAYPLLLLSGVVFFGISFFAARHISNKIFRTTFARILQKTATSLPLGLLVITIFAAEIMATLAVWTTAPEARELSLSPTPPATVLTNSHALGQLLYTEYFYAFQTVGIILLVAMIGAIVLTHRKREGVKRQKVSEQISRTPADAIEMRRVNIGEGVQ